MPLDDSIDPEVLLSILLDSPIESALVQPYRTAPGTTMHLDLRAKVGHVVISASAADVSDGEEAFYLVATDHDLQQWWEEGATSQWRPQDLMAGWAGQGVVDLFLRPRRARFYYDEGDRRLGLRESGIFDSAAAIELTSLVADGSERVVLFATPDITFSVEIATAADRQDEILRGLKEFTPQSVKGRDGSA